MEEFSPAVGVSFILPVWLLEKADRWWQVTVSYHKLNQQETPVSAPGIECTRECIPFVSRKEEFRFTRDGQQKIFSVCPMALLSFISENYNWTSTV